MELAARHGIDLPTARAVELALREELSEVHALEQLSYLFRTPVGAGPVES